MIRYIIINIIITMIIIYYYWHHCHPLFVQGSNGEVRCTEGGVGGDQSLGGSLGGYRGDTVLLEVGWHGRVAAQSLQLFSQHAAAARGRRGGVGYRGAHRQAFGLLAGGSKVGAAALKHAADVVQEVVEELRDAFITCKDKIYFLKTYKCDSRLLLLPVILLAQLDLFQNQTNYSKLPKQAEIN